MTATHVYLSYPYQPAVNVSSFNSPVWTEKQQCSFLTREFKRNGDVSNMNIANSVNFNYTATIIKSIPICC